MALIFLKASYCLKPSRLTPPPVIGVSAVKQEFCGRERKDFISILRIRNEKNYMLFLSWFMWLDCEPK